MFSGFVIPEKARVLLSFTEEQKHTYPQQTSKFKSWTQTVSTSIRESSGALCIGVRNEFEKGSEKR